MLVRSWWRHQLEVFSALLALCAGNSPVTGEFPPQRPVTWSFDIFFDLYLNKRLSKHSWGWWVEAPSRSLWRHCNVCPVTRRRWANSVPSFGLYEEWYNSDLYHNSSGSVHRQVSNYLATKMSAQRFLWWLLHISRCCHIKYISCTKVTNLCPQALPHPWPAVRFRTSIVSSAICFLYPAHCVLLILCMHFITWLILYV